MNQWSRGSRTRRANELDHVRVQTPPLGYESRLGSNEKEVKTAGDQKMKALAFFDAANATLNEQKARGLASQMDNVFRVFFDAKYEHGFAKGIDRLASALSNENTTVRELADVADAFYAFLGEPSVA